MPIFSCLHIHQQLRRPYYSHSTGALPYLCVAKSHTLMCQAFSLKAHVFITLYLPSLDLLYCYQLGNVFRYFLYSTHSGDIWISQQHSGLIDVSDLYSTLQDKIKQGLKSCSRIICSTCTSTSAVFKSFRKQNTHTPKRKRFGFTNIAEVLRKKTDLPRVIVPQLVVQAVRVSFLPLDLSDDIKHLWVRAAGAGAPICIWLTVWVTAAVVWKHKNSGCYSI